MEVYLDHAASTPMLAEVLDAMLPWMTDHYGNATGMHRMARDARKAIDDAREQIAVAMGMSAGGVVFCGSGTEAANLAVFGVHDAQIAAAMSAGTPRPEVWVSAIEHHAVLNAGVQRGATVISVDEFGRVDAQKLRADLRQARDEGRHVGLVSVMLSNNEIGTIQDIVQIARAVHGTFPGSIVHTDSVNAFPWLDVAALCSEVDVITASAHKVGGPKGVGVLGARDNVRLTAQIVGGGQERERRSGTQNTAGIVGAGVAFAATVSSRSEYIDRVTSLRNTLGDYIIDNCTGATETVPRAMKTASNLHLTFDGVEGESLLLLCDAAGVYASAGSSCASGALEPSHVLEAVGTSTDRIRSALRVSLGVATTQAEVEYAGQAVVAAVQRAKAFRPRSHSA
jgi:cysteine desulfurase